MLIYQDVDLMMKILFQGRCRRAKFISFIRKTKTIYIIDTYLAFNVLKVIISRNKQKSK